MKNIIYIGHFKDASGYANAARGYLKLLDKYLDHTQYNLKIIPINFEKEDYSNLEDKKLIQKYLLQEPLEFIKQNKYYLYVHCLPNFNNISSRQIKDLPIKECLENNNCIKKINMVAWETDKVPLPWLNIYKQKIYDELIVFCNWNKQVFESQTGLKSTVVYHPVYDIFDSDNQLKNEKFNIFSMSQWQYRKGFDILVRAYYQEFHNHNDVELFIKTYRSETSKGFDENEQKQIIVKDITDYKNSCIHYGELSNCKISLKTGFCSKEEIKSFYEKADVYCLPTRGEGFGLGIAQAALSGKPCIVPDLGGHLDYIDKENNFLIESRYEPPIHMPFPVYSSMDMNLIEPSVSSTRKQLRAAYNDWKQNKLLIRGIESKNYASRILNEESIFKSFMETTNV